MPEGEHFGTYSSYWVLPPGLDNMQPLRGAASEKKYGFVIEHTELTVDPVHTIFPILKCVDGQWHLIGTGFFIAGYGIFATAKHVLLDVCDKDGEATCAIGILHSLPGRYFFRRIVHVCWSSIADVAIGIVDPMKEEGATDMLNNGFLGLTPRVPLAGAQVVTYAYPNHMIENAPEGAKIALFPAMYEGSIEEYFPKGRDRIMMPGPCFQTSILMHGGSSGGPVFDEHGRVFGICSTGWDDLPLSFVSRISAIFALFLNLPMDWGSPETRRFSVPEMVERKWIDCFPATRFDGRAVGYRP